MLLKPLLKHLGLALLAGLILRLFFIWRYPFYSGDTAYYEELARNWLYHGVYGFYSHGQLFPSDARVPGFPAFLTAVYLFAGTGRMAVMLAQTVLDLGTCVVAAALAARMAAGASESAQSGVAIAALWLTALCPFTANYVAVPLTEVLATFITTLALFIFLSSAGMRLEATLNNRELRQSLKVWLVGGLVVGFGTLIRPETPLLLVAVFFLFAWRYRRPSSHRLLRLDKNLDVPISRCLSLHLEASRRSAH